MRRRSWGIGCVVSAGFQFDARGGLVKKAGTMLQPQMNGNLDNRTGHEADGAPGEMGDGFDPRCWRRSGFFPLSRQQTDNRSCLIAPFSADRRVTASFWWPHQLKMIDAESDRKFVQGYDCWVTAAALKAADVLLAETRDFREMLLGQALLLPKPLNILSNQSAHIHAQQVRASWSFEAAL